MMTYLRTCPDVRPSDATAGCLGANSPFNGEEGNAGGGSAFARQRVFETQKRSTCSIVPRRPQSPSMMSMVALKSPRAATFASPTLRFPVFRQFSAA